MKIKSIVHLRHSYTQVKPRNIIRNGESVSNNTLFEIAFGGTHSLDIVSDELKTKGQITRAGGKVYHNGGLTRVIVEENGKEYIGESYCNLSDRFNCQKGIQIALGRAKKSLTEGS